METNKKYSRLNRPLTMIFDIIIIFLVLIIISDKEFSSISFLIYISVLWVIISFYTKFYNIYRYTHLSKLISLIFWQFFIFSLAFLSFFSLFREGTVVHNQLLTLSLIAVTITFFKLFSFIFLKKYRSSGNDNRSVIVFGNNKVAKKVAALFNRKQDLGYHFFGFFSDVKSSSKKYLGLIKDGLKYSKEKGVDEIYCDVVSISPTQLKEIANFSKKNGIEVRLIPENKAIYSKDFTLEYYGTIPILKPKQLPFEKIETHLIKRIFDIAFSLIICVFILSWLLPILWLLVKIDSKGSFFFKQIRDGVNGKQFYCYKIRSMKINSLSHKISATKDDQRITKIGAFIRKTSLDELPQFFNVLKGDMSIIGPRPHMNIQTEKYLKEIDNYIIRNSVKPGITGLAQVSGYRGEVQKKSDIENRVRLDIFYIENWSFFLDIKIIFQTIFSVFKGEEKAY